MRVLFFWAAFLSLASLRHYHHVPIVDLTIKNTAIHICHVQYASIHPCRAYQGSCGCRSQYFRMVHFTVVWICSSSWASMSSSYPFARVVSNTHAGFGLLPVEFLYVPLRCGRKFPCSCMTSFTFEFVVMINFVKHHLVRPFGCVRYLLNSW